MAGFSDVHAQQCVVWPDASPGLATAQYAREGLTSVTDAGIGGGWIGHSPREFAAYQSARDKGLLATRMQPMITADVLHDIPVHSVRGLDAGVRSGAGDSRLQIGPMKMFLDGSLLGGTAALTEPYCTQSESRGYLLDDRDAMRCHAIDAAAGGWALALHAIGRPRRGFRARQVPLDRVGDIDVLATWVGGVATHGELRSA